MKTNTQDGRRPIPPLCPNQDKKCVKTPVPLPSTKKISLKVCRNAGADTVT